MAAARIAREKARAEAGRQSEIARMARMAAGTSLGGSGGDAHARGTGAGGKGQKGTGKDATSRGGFSASYAARVRNRVYPNIRFHGGNDGAPVTVVRVRAGADGHILFSRVVKPSTDPDWDQAVLNALERTGTLPADVDGQVPQVPFTITFKRH